MAEKNKGKMVESITSMDTDFAQWYTDVVLRAELIDYSTVRGHQIMIPRVKFEKNVVKVIENAEK